MAIVVEDGTGKSDANSYVTTAEAVVYAAARGLTITEDKAAVYLVLSTDYLETFACKYQGEPTYPTQALQWPRTGVVFGKTAFPDDQIPNKLKQAQMQAVVEQANGFNLMPSTDGRIVKREKVDVLETEYATGNDWGESGGPVPSFPAIDALLAPLFSECGCGEGFGLRLVRI
jgi:hypothetical protein